MENDILLGNDIPEEEEALAHVGRSVLDGAPIGSGRYRYGSGEDAYQHVKNFHTTVQELRRGKNGKPGMTDTEIAKHLQMTTSELRSKISQNKEAMTAHEVAYSSSTLCLEAVQRDPS